jgi:hypothetical protein
MFRHHVAIFPQGTRDRLPSMGLGEARTRRRPNQQRLGNIRPDFAVARGGTEHAGGPAHHPLALRLARAYDLLDQTLESAAIKWHWRFRRRRRVPR